MERVQEKREEINAMIDALYVRQGSPSFVHQLRSLLQQVEDFLRKIGVSIVSHTPSIPYFHTLTLPYCDISMHSYFHTVIHALDNTVIL